MFSISPCTSGNAGGAAGATLLVFNNVVLVAIGLFFFVRLAEGGCAKVAKKTREECCWDERRGLREGRREGERAVGLEARERGLDHMAVDRVSEGGVWREERVWMWRDGTDGMLERKVYA